MKILVLDNYDSFTYNLVHILKEHGKGEVDVFRNDEISLEDVGRYDKILISPGPGLPGQAGITKELITRYGPSKSILGVCLGCQAIAEVYGGTLINLSKVYHGVETNIQVISEGNILFKGIPEVFTAGRYHSWVVSEEGLPGVITITAKDDEGRVMALEHAEYDVRGVQFHPESVMTEHGKQILINWLNI